MKQLVLKNALGIDEGKDLLGLKAKKEELEQQIKEKDEYINFLTEKPPFPMTGTETEGGEVQEVREVGKLREVQRKLEEVKDTVREVRVRTESNKAAMDDVWPHLMNIMLTQCM
ncbi:MAG: hypothetical protein P4L10_17015 [Acidobacteriaceae bacterium]|nr:hypothetical protein [Acidobacteriaceae bacterium]